MGQKILKNPDQKNLWNQINQFDEKKIFFSKFKNDQKSIFEEGKGLKLLEMQLHEKKGIYLISPSKLLDFTSFFAWTFFNFLARCESSPSSNVK